METQKQGTFPNQIFHTEINIQHTLTNSCVYRLKIYSSAPHVKQMHTNKYHALVIVSPNDNYSHKERVHHMNPVNFPHCLRCIVETFFTLLVLCEGNQKCQWRGSCIFSFMCAWTNVWTSSTFARDLRHHEAHLTSIWYFGQIFCRDSDQHWSVRWLYPGGTRPFPVSLSPYPMNIRLIHIRQMYLNSMCFIVQFGYFSWFSFIKYYVSSQLL